MKTEPITRRRFIGQSACAGLGLSGLLSTLGTLLPVYNTGDMAILCNVGTLVAPITKAEYLSGGAAIPPHLFSHNDQQVQWQTSVPDSPRKVGWGGRIAALLQGLNAGSDISMNVSIAGSNFFQVGEQVLQYHVTPQGSIGLDGTKWNWSPWPETFAQNTQMLGRSYGHIFEQEYANIMKRGIANDALLKAAIAANPLPAGVGAFPNSLDSKGGLNRVASQLRMIHARQTLGMKRQIFFEALGEILRFYRMDFGSFPAGQENRDIMNALTGNNPGRLPVFPLKHPRIDADGYLLDAWENAFIFHPVGGQHLEIRSKGPDGVIFTKDDIVVPPQSSARE